MARSLTLPVLLIVSSVLVAAAPRAPGDLAPRRAQAPPPAAEPAREVETTVDASTSGRIEVIRLPKSDRVRGISVLARNAGRLDWSLQGDRIAFDRADRAGLYDVYVMGAGGGNERCLTCNFSELRDASALAPAWHPSGRYVAFLVQRTGKRFRLGAAGLTTPDRGLHGEIWLVGVDGRRLWTLVRGDQTGGAVLDPRFSFEGDRLAWSERQRSRTGRWGDWVARVADFEVSRGIPRLRKVRRVAPPVERTFLEVSGFGPQERRLLVSGNLDPGQDESGMDVAWLDLEAGAVTRLTDSRGEWDQGAVLSPSGDALVWTSNRGLDRRPLPPLVLPPTARPERRELWWRPLDGGEPERLTYFNHPASPSFDTGAVVSDVAWSPDGTRIAIHVVTDLAAGQESIYLVTLR